MLVTVQLKCGLTHEFLYIPLQIKMFTLPTVATYNHTMNVHCVHK